MENRIPDKRYFRIGEVSALTELEPHVIRYWEKEFPRLKPMRADSRQRLYSREDVRLIMDIRRLLHEERYTIAGARKRLMGQGPEAPQPESDSPPPPELSGEDIQNDTQPDLPLFPEEKAILSSQADNKDHTPLLRELKQELGRIIRVLS